MDVSVIFAWIVYFSFDFAGCYFNDFLRKISFRKLHSIICNCYHFQHKRGPKRGNCKFLLYFSSNFNGLLMGHLKKNWYSKRVPSSIIWYICRAYIFFKFIELRVTDSMSTDFLYLLWFRRYTQLKESNKIKFQNLSFLFFSSNFNVVSWAFLHLSHSD